VQTGLEFNHIALVERGRNGSDVRVMDHSPFWLTGNGGAMRPHEFRRLVWRFTYDGSAPSRRVARKVTPDASRPSLLLSGRRRPSVRRRLHGLAAGVLINKGNEGKLMFGKIQSKEATIDPNRAALAAAIAQRDAAQRKVDAAKASVERASAMLEEAAARASAARAALVGRRSEGAQRVLEAATTGAPGLPDVSMREARVADLDASDGLEAAKSALASCMAALKDAEADFRHAEWRVERAVAPVLAGAADRVLAEAARLKDELDGARAVAFEDDALVLGQRLAHHRDQKHAPGAPAIGPQDLAKQCRVR
jgi:Uncharacterized protein conserved in bacteria (DUF2213)